MKKGGASNPKQTYPVASLYVSEKLLSDSHFLNKLMNESWNSDFSSVAAYYCSKLYPKEKRAQRARQLVRQFDTHFWNGTLNHLVWLLLNKVAKKDELISISPKDDVLEALEAEGLME